MFLSIATANLPNHKVEHIFSLHKAFLMNASQLQLENYNSENKFWQIFCGYIFAYDETVTILSRLIFAFARSVLLISNVLMARKEELFIKSPKLQ